VEKNKTLQAIPTIIHNFIHSLWIRTSVEVAEVLRTTQKTFLGAAVSSDLRLMYFDVNRDLQNFSLYSRSGWLRGGLLYAC
jgi:hypothetical protein